MARFTKGTPSTSSRSNGSALTASPQTDALTGNGGKGFTYSDKSALFILGVTNFTGQNEYYESGKARDDRYKGLIRAVAAEDPRWVAEFISWLRSSGNIRTAAITGAVEYGRAVSGSQVPADISARAVLRSVLQRADEPSEALGYWLLNYGKPLPKWFKRAIGDAAASLYNEKSVLKYDSRGATVRFADVISLSQVDTTGKPYKAAVFSYAQDRRYGDVDLSRYPVHLPVVATRAMLDDVPASNRQDFLLKHPELVDKSGHTWESLASWLGGELTASFWEAMIPNMGYMALIRNLRNFAKAGISQPWAKEVASRIADPDGVASSRQLPLRFLSAYRAIDSSTEYTSAAIPAQYRKPWSLALSQALETSLASVPSLTGRTIIMIDTSGSMFSRVSDHSAVTYYDNAAMFGIALGLRAENALVFGYDTHATQFGLSYDSSLLANAKRFRTEVPVGGGTETIRVADILMHDYGAVDRLIIVTDEQASPYGGRRKTLDAVVPKTTNLFTFNLAGYGVSQAKQGRDNIFSVAGLTDSAFQMISSVEAAGSGAWPWEL